MENVFGDTNYSSAIIKSLKSKYILLNSTSPALDRVVYGGKMCCIERFTDSRVRLSVSERNRTLWKQRHILWHF